MPDFTEAMTWLGRQPDTLFLGQGVGCSGTKMSASFEGVPEEKRVEMPVAEQLQLGISIGLALEGFVPVSVFPRINFLLCAADMLVNHLDKLPIYSDGGYRPKVILRTAVGSREPLDAGPQHTGDYSAALAAMLRTVKVARLYPTNEVGKARVVEHDKETSFRQAWDGGYPGIYLSPQEVYRHAYEHRSSTLIVEE